VLTAVQSHFTDLNYGCLDKADIGNTKPLFAANHKNALADDHENHQITKRLSRRISRMEATLTFQQPDSSSLKSLHLNLDGIQIFLKQSRKFHSKLNEQVTPCITSYAMIKQRGMKFSDMDIKYSTG
jgi:hypothetical protein